MTYSTLNNPSTLQAILTFLKMVICLLSDSISNLPRHISCLLPFIFIFYFFKDFSHSRSRLAFVQFTVVNVKDDDEVLARVSISTSSLQKRIADSQSNIAPDSFRIYSEVHRSSSLLRIAVTSWRNKTTRYSTSGDYSLINISK